MSRHRHKRSADTGAPARIASLKAMRATLAAEFGLEPSDARIGQAALVKLNQENWQGQILLGRPVPACELEAYTNTVATLLGKPKTDISVHFLATMAKCPKCGFEAEETDADRAWEAARHAKNDPPEPAVQPVEPINAVPSDIEPAANADAPVASENVVPLKPAPSPPKPIKSDTDFAPWRDITGTGRIEGREAPSGRFKCYGDIPDGF